MTKPVGNEQLKPDEHLRCSVCGQESYSAVCIPCEARASAPVQGDVISRAEAVRAAKEQPCTCDEPQMNMHRTDKPRCRVLIGRDIAETIAALPATSTQATPDARERARELVNTWAEDNNVVRIGSYWQELESDIAEALNGCAAKPERVEIMECIRRLNGLLIAERKDRAALSLQEKK